MKLEKMKEILNENERKTMDKLEVILFKNSTDVSSFNQTKYTKDL